jgi:Domain of unknown function (DUF4232)
VRDVTRLRVVAAAALIGLGVAGCTSASSAGHASQSPAVAEAPTSPTPPVESATAVASASASPRASQVHSLTARCSKSALTLSGPLPGFGGATGERELTYAVRNVGGRRCSLNGFPVIRLGGSRPLPFVYETAAGPYLSKSAPRNVTLASHGVAYLQVAKYRCDLGDGPRASSIRITMPNNAGRFIEAVPTTVPGMAFCVGQDRDPGNVVRISPIRATAGDLIP